MRAVIISRPFRSTSVRHTRRGGFTLVEIMVVLVIGSIITSIVIGGFGEMRQGNKRVGCQTNMAQIYQGLRLYSNDYGGGFPFYDVEDAVPADTVTGKNYQNLGLWLLYGFPTESSTDPDGINYDALAPLEPQPVPTPQAKPIERYIRNAKVLHCPADSDSDSNDARQFLVDPVGNYNPQYLSYQWVDKAAGNVGGGLQDPLGPDASNPEVSRWQPYQSVRYVIPQNKLSDPIERKLWERQLLHFVDQGTAPVFRLRPPAPDTVVTWCRFHRDDRGRGGFDGYDNVLFYDGSVQYLPTEQENPVPNGATPLVGWQRVPKPVE